MRQFREQSAPSRSNCLKLDKYSLFLSLFLFTVGIFLLPKTAYLSSITPEKLIELTNIEREKAGIAPLEENVYLEEAAARKAETILEEQIFDHSINGRKFSSWIKEVGYEYSFAGENLAIDFLSAEGVVKAWLESEGHRKNLLNEEYREIGIAVFEGTFAGARTIIVAQIFGTPLKTNVPAEIAARNERLSPLSPTVLAANEHRPDANFFAAITETENISRALAISAGLAGISLSLFTALFIARLQPLSLMPKQLFKK